MTSSTAPKTSQDLTSRDLTSRDLPGPRQRSDKPRTDGDRDTQGAVVEEAGEAGDTGRDLVHGDGGTIDLPTKPGDLSQDD